MPPVVFAPRSNTTQQVNYIRKTLNFGAIGTQLIGSLPVNTVISTVAVSVSTPFNAGTTNPVTLGITPNGAELMAAGDNTPGTAGYYTATRGLGNALTQAAGAPNTVGDPEGGVGVYLTFAPTGTAPTAGSAVVTVSFVPPTDT